MLFPLGRRVLLRLTLVAAAASVPLAAQQPSAPGGRVILVLPFENRSGNTSLNWIGDSFPDTLDARLNSAGFLTISHDDRVFAYDHLGLPAGFRPSRATTIRIAQQLDANVVVVGSYTANNDQISLQAQVLNVDDLHLSAPLEDGAELNRLFDAENAIAWKIARFVDPHFQVAERTFLGAGGAVPLSAFEAYIRGTTATDRAERLKRLGSAVQQVPSYAAALLALGKEQYAARDFAAAATTLAKVPPESPLALEANFYLGLAHFNSAQYAQAAKAFGFVVSRLPLPEAINDQAVALSRQGTNATAYFQRASSADPNDEDYHYNLAVSLAHAGDTAGAAREVDTALQLKPRDVDAAQLKTALASLPAGGHLPASTDAGIIAVERIRRDYSEAGYRQAAFALDQLRSARLATLPPAQASNEYTALGNQYLGQGLLPEAEQQFASALAVDPHSAPAHAGLAQIRESSGDTTGARAEANASLEIQPNVASLLVLARLELAGNNLTESANDVSRALKLEPRNSAALALQQNLQSRGQTVAP